MILIAGGTGNLGRQVVRLLTTRGLKVRILTRDPNQVQLPMSELVEVVRGDVRDLPSVERAMAGVDTVISAMHGFTGKRSCNPKTVDYLGNRNLIEAAKTVGVDHFILVSINGASSDHPMQLFRMKFRAEQELRESGLRWTIIRPTAYMETWAKLIGEPLIQAGKTRVFGRGRNPINFISVHDVAQIVELSILDQSLRGEVLTVGGPENLTMRQVVEVFSNATGMTGTTDAVPLPVMRALSALMRPLNPTLARQIQAGIVMDTTDQQFDASQTRQRLPSIRFTTFASMAKRDYANDSTPEFQLADESR